MRKRIGAREFFVLVWLAGVTSFYFAIAVVFATMIATKKHQQIVLYEPNNLVFWSELVLMILILLLTIWILYNYASGKARLELVDRKRQ